MARWYIKHFIRFFERRRGRFLTFVGMMLILPNIVAMERTIKRLEKQMDDDLIMKGRLDLLAEILRRNWKR